MWAALWRWIMSLVKGDRLFPVRAADGRIAGLKCTGAKEKGDRFIPVQMADGRVAAVKVVAVKEKGQRGIPVRFADGQIGLAKFDSGMGPIFVCGSFSEIGGLARSRIANINADGSVSDWNPSFTGTVWSMVALDGNLWVASDLQAGLKSVHSFTLDGADRQLATTANNTSRIIATDGENIFFGGTFGLVNGETRTRLASVDQDGSLLSWVIPAEWERTDAVATVRGIGCDGGSVYADGLRFGASRHDAETGDYENWYFQWRQRGPSARRWAFDSAWVYLAGSFRTDMFSTLGSYLAKASKTPSAPAYRADQALDASFDPGLNGSVGGMVKIGNKIYFGGAFTDTAGGARNRLACIDTDGTMQSWDPDANGAVFAIAHQDGLFYIGGEFTEIGGKARNRLACVDEDGAVTDWNPGANSGVQDIVVV